MNAHRVPRSPCRRRQPLLAIAGALCLTLAACSRDSPPESQTPPTATIPAPPAGPTTPAPDQPSTSVETASVRFAGRLPCDDCEALDTQLTLQVAGGGEPAGYWFEQRPLGGPPERGGLASIGEWRIVRGTPRNPDATAFELIGRDGARRYLRVVDESTLVWLGPDGEEPSDPARHRLTATAR